MKLIKLFYLLLLLNACETGSGEKKTRLSSVAIRLKATISDSIPLFDDKLSFSYVNLQKIDKDTILAFQHPILNLSLLNSKGKLIKEISRKGELKGQFIGDFIEPYFAEDGNLYVLEEGNASRITVFNTKLEFIRHISLNKYLNGSYCPPVKANILVDAIANASSKRILLGIGSTIHHPNEQKYYKELASIAELKLDLKEINSEITYRLPYKDFESIKNALSNNKKTWDMPFAFFKKSGDQLFVKFEFDNLCYVYDFDTWELKTEIEVHPAYQAYNFTNEFRIIKDPAESFADMWKLRFSNIYYNAFDVKGNKIFMVYPKSIPLSKVPQTSQQYLKHISLPVLHIIDYQTKEEYYVDLPSHLSIEKLYALNEKEIYMTGNSLLNEDIYLYKLQINYD